MSLVLRKWIRSAVIGTKKFTKPIVHLGRIEELPQENELCGKVKLGLISDKETYIRAIFTRASLVKYEGEGRTLNYMRGMIISLQDYTILANIGTDRRYSEFVAEIYKFNIVSEERHRAVPHIKDINQDQIVQSKLAQKWRDKQLSKDTNDSNCLVVYSQMEESQLSQDQLSQLLSVMNANSQVYSYEAISSSQQIELGNLSGWAVKSEQCLDEASQDTTYATPQLDTPVGILDEQDEESDDTMTYKTPPQGLTSPPVSTTDQHSSPVVQSNSVSTSVQESELLSPSQRESELYLPSEQDSTLVAVEEVKDYSQLLQNEVNSVSVKLSKPVPECIKILNSQRATSGGDSQSNKQESEKEMANSPPQANHADELSQFCEMSNSQMAEIDNIWTDTQHQPSQCNSDTNNNQRNERQQPYTDSLSTLATPNNHDNLVDNTTLQTATSNQQPHSNHQPASPKGKGGTTKDIHLTDSAKKLSNTSLDVGDHVTSVSTSQQDELDEQWWEDEACCSDPSSLEVFDDFYPIQLEPYEAATQQQEQPVNITDIPVQSNIVVFDNSSMRLNQGDSSKTTRLKRKRKTKVSLDQFDQQLFEQVEDSDNETTPAKKETSLLSTELITRLLDASNNKATSTVTVSKAVPQAASNAHMASSQVNIEHSYCTRRKSQSNSPEGMPSSKKKQELFSDSDDDNVTSDVGNPDHVIAESNELHSAEDEGFWCNFKPLLTEADIDDFIDTYWTRKRLHNMAFNDY